MLFSEIVFIFSLISQELTKTVQRQCRGAAVLSAAQSAEKKKEENALSLSSCFGLGVTSQVTSSVAGSKQNLHSPSYVIGLDFCSSSEL